MSIGMHATENSWPPSLFDVDLTLSEVVSSDEERGFGFVCRKHVENMICEIVWTVVEGQGHFALVRTMPDTASTICDVADMRS
jgi:hypothetical protein